MGYIGENRLSDLLTGLKGKLDAKQNVIAGGDSGQILSKNSNVSGDFRWIDPPQNGAVNSVNGKTGDVVLNSDDVNAVPAAAKGARNGVAELGPDGKVPVSQLPSYVDEVLEYPRRVDFPATGEASKIYIDLSTNVCYRWGGSTYVPVGSTLALGETDQTAYRGDRGKIAYDHASDPNKITSGVNIGLYKLSATSEGHISNLSAVTKQDILDLGIVDPGTLPIPENGILTIRENGRLITTFTANSKDDVFADICVPEKLSELRNDVGFISRDTVNADDALSLASTYVVQNKVVTAALDGKQDALVFDDNPVAGSNNPVKSNGIYNAVSGKQNTITGGNAGQVLTKNSNAEGDFTWTTPQAVAVDSELSMTSENPVQNKVITESLSHKLESGDLARVAFSGDYNDLDNAPVIPPEITVDTTMSGTSVNPVQNKVITEALLHKVDKEEGKGLSANDFTDALKAKLDGIEDNAEVNVQADWNEEDTTSDAYIKNKPIIPPGLTVDDELSTTSENPVQNKVITATLDNKVDKEAGKGLSANDFTDTLKEKLDGIAKGAEVNVQANWNETDETSDAYIKNKPEIQHITVDEELSTESENPVQNKIITAALADKVPAEPGKGLSTNDFTEAYRLKLEGIEENAEVNVQADWNETDIQSDAYIKNKPAIPAPITVDTAIDPTSANPVQNQVIAAALSAKADAADFADVAYSGDYDDLINKPVIPVYSVDDHLSTESENPVQNKVITSALDSKVEVIPGKGLSTNDFTDEEKAKLAGIEAGAQVNEVFSVNGRKGDVVVTASELGAMPLAYKGAPNGVAELDENGIVPESQLPPLVIPDDAYNVVTYTTMAEFPETGVDNRIYIDRGSQRLYRWGIEPNVPTPHYVEVGLRLGTADNQAFPGDMGMVAYNHAVDSSKISSAVDLGFYKVAATSDGHFAELVPVDKQDIMDLGIDIPNNGKLFVNVNNSLIGTFSANQSSDMELHISVPTKLSDLVNDTGFIDNTVDNLINYYTKSETYTKSEVDAAINAIVSLNIEVVQQLPTHDISTTTIYLVPNSSAEQEDIYDEYIYVNNNWEHIGSTQVDLSNYYTSDEVDNLLDGKVDKVAGKQLSTEDFTTDLKTKLDGIEVGAEVNVQADWNEDDSTSDAYIQNKPTIPAVYDGALTIQRNGYTVAVFTANHDVNVTADIAVPTKTSELTNDSGFITEHAPVDSALSTTSENAVQNKVITSALNGKADAVPGKGLSTNDFTDAYKAKLDGIEEGAEANVQSDWNESDPTSDAFILNKPTIPPEVVVDDTISSTSENPVQNKVIKSALDGKVDTEPGKGLSSNDFTDAYKNKVDGIEAGAEVNVQADWEEDDATSDAYIQNKPSIPTVNDGILTIRRNNHDLESFSANSSSNVVVDIAVPTKTSELENDSGFLTEHLPVDSMLSTTSENAVQNKIITAALNGKVDADPGKGLSTNDYTDAEKAKLAGIEAGAEVNVQADWDQTDDQADDFIKNKPAIPPEVVIDDTISSTSENPVQNKVIKSALDGKVDAVAGKGLSEEDFTTVLKAKLEGIAAGAEVNVQADWDESDPDSDAFILNKPTIPPAISVDSTLSTTSENPVQNKVITSALAAKADSSSLATVATTGSYNDLTDLPDSYGHEIYNSSGTAVTQRSKMQFNGLTVTDSNDRTVVSLNIAGTDTEGAFLTSDGLGGYRWTVVPQAEGSSF